MNTLKIILAILVMGAIITTVALGICTLIDSEGCLALSTTAILGLMVVMEVPYWLP